MTMDDNMLTPTSKVLEGVPDHVNNRSSAPTFQATE
ncbi:hypothetical protein ACP4OV_028476 [Aristida adscensionis]